MELSMNLARNRYVNGGRLLAAGAVAGLTLLGGCKRAPQAALTAPPPEVATIVVSEREVLLTAELPGRTAPFRIAEIRPQVSGLIQKRLFEEGSEVKEGQPLYQIDPAPFNANLENAKAGLGRAEANLPAIELRAKRYQEALADRAVSQQDYDDAMAALKQAQAEVSFHKATVETAKINLGYALVRSPISGRIGASAVTDGAIVTAYQPVPLCTIQQLDPIYVDVAQSSSELLNLRRRMSEGHIGKGTNVTAVGLELENETRYPLEGKLEFTDVSVDQTMGTVILRMVFPNPDQVLLPGMFVRATVQEGVSPRAILIPQQAVSRDHKGTPLAMLVNAESKVELRQLTIDRAIGSEWLVTSGLKAGDHLIMEGSQRVRPGVPVKEVPMQTAASADERADTTAAAAAAAH